METEKIGKRKKTDAIVSRKDLTKRISGLRSVWGDEDMDRVLLWCWKYAEIESGHLQLHEGCDDHEYERRLAGLAKDRTSETIGYLVDFTRLTQEHMSTKLEREVGYGELKNRMADLNLRFNFICTKNYEALIHQRHYEPGHKEIELEDIFK